MASQTIALDDLAPGTATRIVIDGVPIAVVRIDDDVYAISDICSHANVSLSGGEVWCEEREIECPKHGSTFDLRTGEPQSLPAVKAVPTYIVKVEDDEVRVEIP